MLKSISPNRRASAASSRKREHCRQLASAGVRVASSARSFQQQQPKVGQKLPIELTWVFAVVDGVLDHAESLAGVAAP